MEKILLFCNDSNKIMIFRKDLILSLVNNNYDVFVIGSDNKRQKDIEDLGAKFYLLNFTNRSKNIFSLFRENRKAKQIMKEIKPDILFTFQAKPNIIGCNVSKKVGTNKVFAMVEGLGDPFQPHSIFSKIFLKAFCLLYKKSFKNINKVFFLNDNDCNEFVSRKIIDKNKTVIINSIGIDTNYFIYSPDLPENKNVIIISRLIKNKGIIDCFEIAKKVRETRKDISFSFYGEEQELTRQDISKYLDANYITYKEFDTDIKSRIKESRILLSCSFYKEGFPRSILEAMSIGRATIATNVVGNNSAVIDGVTGYLLPVHDIDAFANKIIELIDNDLKLLSFGKNARKICEEKYDSKVINDYIISIIND